MLNRITPVGVLDHDGSAFRFQYLPDLTGAAPGFRAFIGFPDLSQVYVSARLWPFFDLRVMDAKRPDFQEYVERLGLSPGATRLDILSRSGGEQKGDNVSLVEAPPVGDAGETETHFLIRGSRYATTDFDSIAVAEALQPGDELALVNEPSNLANPEAILVTTSAGAPVGWVPDLLIQFARDVRSRGGRLTVVRNNGRDTPWHMRLLVRLSGHVAPGTAPFSGDHWPEPRSIRKDLDLD